MKIGIIDNFDSFVYNLVRYVRETANTDTVVQRNNAVDYGELDSCDAILLSPGPGIPEEAGELKNVIRRYAGKKSLLGICLGHQAIAEVFGGSLISCPEPVHGKSSPARVCSEIPLFAGLPKQFEAGRYHSWQVTIPSDSVLEAAALAEDGTIMALHHQHLPVYGLQFHPESILTPTGRMMIHNWINSIS